MAHRNPNISAQPFRFAMENGSAASIRRGALPLPDVAREALRVLEESGGEVWCVGGCVRDALLERPVHDVDLATNLPWPLVQKAFRDEGWGTVETGVAHGTLTVVRDGEPLEITTYRCDGTYSDGRHPDAVTPAATIEEDLLRRDFTVNALAYHPDRGIIDPFGGAEDIGRGIIRCVGDPTSRFSEDALRILRACRFASQLGFAIEKTTFDAMLASKHLLRKVSGERIYRELERFLCGDYVHDALMACVDVLAFVLPELVAMKGCEQVTKYHIYDVLEHTAFAMERMPPTRLGRWAALFHDMGKPAAAFIGPDGREHFYAHAQVSMALARGVMGRMQMSQGFQKKVLALVEHHDDAMEPTARSVKRMLARLGGDAELLRTLCHLKRADALAQAPFCAERAVLAEELEAILDDILAEGAAFSIRDLAISGRDLIGCGVPKGPRVGALLEEALEAVVDERVANEREALIELLGL